MSEVRFLSRYIRSLPQGSLAPRQLASVLRSFAWCSVLQCDEVCCSVLQCVVVCCSMLQCFAVRCSVLLCVAVCDNVS